MPRGAAHSGFRPSCPVLPFQMARGSALLLASLLLAAALSASAGLWSPAKEKRGWTLNSAGYLLGPHAVGNHRSFSDKNGLTSKRELQPQDDVKPGERTPIPGSRAPHFQQLPGACSGGQLWVSGHLPPICPQLQPKPGHDLRGCGLATPVSSCKHNLQTRDSKESF
uniref:Galanin and GMAP prepropeptide n=1 Tax=Macaca fascicularis TaxID=9541 RepID=A0A7N9CBP1_MACFA